METEGSFPHSQPATTGIHPKLDQSIPASPSNYLQFDFNIILTSTPWSSMSPLSLMSPQQIPVCTSPVSHTYHMHRLFRSKKTLRPRLLGLTVKAQSLNRLTYPGRQAVCCWSFDMSFSLVFFLPKAGDCA